MSYYCRTAHLAAADARRAEENRQAQNQKHADLAAGLAVCAVAGVLAVPLGLLGAVYAGSKVVDAFIMNKTPMEGCEQPTFSHTLVNALTPRTLLGLAHGVEPLIQDLGARAGQWLMDNQGRLEPAALCRRLFKKRRPQGAVLALPAVA